jgi:alkylation response protein AidB-like acyl-CoA dehydrogenase
MDFAFTDEQLVLKEEFSRVCAELEKRQPSNWLLPMEDKYSSDEGWSYHRYCAKEFGCRGWLSRSWPRAYGGVAASKVEQAIFTEVREYHRVPGVDFYGVRMLAPTLLSWGTNEQKGEHLPPIASGDSAWCQLWSEPNAGSDLAAVTTTAVRRGNHYVINGQKIWTTGAHRAEWGYVLVRTDPAAQPKNRGLSFLLVDMRTSGITVRPLYFMNLTHMYNEVFFEDVHVPVDNLVGEENRGWHIVRAVSNSERSSLDGLMEAKRQLEDLVEWCNQTKLSGKPLAKNALVRNRLAEMASEVEAAHTLAYRVAWLQDKGEFSAVEASATKIFSSELLRRLAFLGADLLGVYSQVKPSKWARLRGFYENAYQATFALTIGAGTNEIQRNIIAWEGLHLPRVR